MPLVTRRQALIAAAAGAVLGVAAKREKDRNCEDDPRRENGTSRPADTPESGSPDGK